MSTYIFINEGLPGVRISVDSDTEDHARVNLQDKLDDNDDWLMLDTVHEWICDTAY